MIGYPPTLAVASSFCALVYPALLDLRVWGIHREQLFQFRFFFDDTATTEIYTLSLHDALPIWNWQSTSAAPQPCGLSMDFPVMADRKSTRLNSSHPSISYAVFCLKKKKKK